MNIGVVISGFPPEEGGGFTFEKEIFQSLVGLAGESRHKFTFLYPKNIPIDVKQLALTDQIQCVPYPSAGPFERIMRRFCLEFSLLRRLWKKPSVIERVGRYIGIDFLWFLGPGGMPVDLPYLSIVWDLQHRLQPWFPEVGSGGIWDDREVLYARFLRRATYVIVGTEAGRKEIEQFYQVPADRIKCLPHPIPGFALDPSPEEGEKVLKKYSLPGNYLLYPAQFWPHKNHANLLLAFRILRNEYGMSLPLVLVGSDKGNLPYVRELASTAGISDQVHFLGFVPLDDLVGLYQNALAMTYVTFFGPENMPPLEAFALGCPVIASNVSGAKEQLGDSTILVDPRNPREIAVAIRSLAIDRGLRDELISRGMKRALQWTSRDFVRGVFSILDEFEPVRRCWK